MPQTKVIMVSGLDACKFLQGQLSCDVEALNNSTSTMGSYCNIKGRVEALFTLKMDNGNYYMIMPTDILDSTLEELKKYAIFSKVNLDIINYEVPEINEAQEIISKIPQVYLATKGLFLAHDLNLPELGAISFSKGCYRGQEIIARMQYKGNIKNKLEYFESTDTSLKPGDKTETGIVVRSFKQADDKLIALQVNNTPHL